MHRTVSTLTLQDYSLLQSLYFLDFSKEKVFMKDRKEIATDCCVRRGARTLK
jgi:hypothetical protein